MQKRGREGGKEEVKERERRRRERHGIAACRPREALAAAERGGAKERFFFSSLSLERSPRPFLRRPRHRFAAALLSLSQLRSTPRSAYGRSPSRKKEEKRVEVASEGDEGHSLGTTMPFFFVSSGRGRSGMPRTRALSPSLSFSTSACVVCAPLPPNHSALGRGLSLLHD